jgi:hypothetical protein
MGEQETGKTRRAATAKRTVIAAATPSASGTQNEATARMRVRRQRLSGDTLGQPAVTLPTIPATRMPDATQSGYSELGAYRAEDAAAAWYGGYQNAYNEAPADSAWAEAEAATGLPQAGWNGVGYEQYGVYAEETSDPGDVPLIEPALTLTPVRRRSDTEARALVTRPPTTLNVRERRARVRALHALGVVFIPGRKLTRRVVPWAMRERVAQGVETSSGLLRRHKSLLVALVALTIVSGAIATATGTFSALGAWANPNWAVTNGSHIAPTPTPPPAPDILDAWHYVNKYGFDWPRNPQQISGAEFDRMVFMLPYAYSATAAYDHRYGASMEPEMVLFWTHAEGIGAHINYSNCANNSPRAGQNYFTDIENCPQSSFWQLGYGNQFSVIYVLKNAFRDTHGDPNDTKLVQQVGQWVLNYDQSQGTVPACGGYSCTFPALTIDQIMGGINETTGVKTADNWWASVLSRDPAINVYMVAHALTFFNHAATLNWVGCYYYEPCWGYESNSLGDVLSSWGNLKRAAHL